MQQALGMMPWLGRRGSSWPADIWEFILGSPRIVKLRVSEDILQAAWDKFRSLRDRPLSFTDCTSLALMEKNGIESIASFDPGFDGLVKRIA
jgi:predicted nucleic acid-binding protein